MSEIITTRSEGGVLEVTSSLLSATIPNYAWPSSKPRVTASFAPAGI